jgi:hypothetical protein
MRTVVAAVIALLVTACIARPDLSPPPSLPSATARPSESTPRPRPTETTIPATAIPATPPPTIPPDLPLAARAERDGVRISIQLERNPMPAGELTWLTTRVTNTSNREVLHWGSDGCEIPLWVFGSMPDLRWRPGAVPPTDQLRTFKSLALERMVDAPVPMGFMPEAFVGKGIDLAEFGCGDIFIGHDLAPGTSVVVREVWDGTAMHTHAPLPTGRLDLHATLDTWWRGDVGPPEVSGQPIEVHLDGWIDGGAAPPAVDPGEAIDAALGDPDFAAWLETRNLEGGVDPFVRYDAASQLWLVGLTTYQPAERTRVCQVDATSGQVVGFAGPLD